MFLTYISVHVSFNRQRVSQRQNILEIHRYNVVLLFRATKQLQGQHPASAYFFLLK